MTSSINGVSNSGARPCSSIESEPNKIVSDKDQKIVDVTANIFCGQCRPINVNKLCATVGAVALSTCLTLFASRIYNCYNVCDEEYGNVELCINGSGALAALTLFWLGKSWAGDFSAIPAKVKQ